MDAKVMEIRREQDSRYRDVDGKLDRNTDSVSRLERTLETELRKITGLLYEAKEELVAAKASSGGVEKYKQWIIPTIITAGMLIIEGIHLLGK